MGWEDEGRSRAVREGNKTTKLFIVPFLGLSFSVTSCHENEHVRQNSWRERKEIHEGHLRLVVARSSLLRCRLCQTRRQSDQGKHSQQLENNFFHSQFSMLWGIEQHICAWKRSASQNAVLPSGLVHYALISIIHIISVFCLRLVLFLLMCLGFVWLFFGGRGRIRLSFLYSCSLADYMFSSLAKISY